MKYLPILLLVFMLCGCLTTEQKREKCGCPPYAENIEVDYPEFYQRGLQARKENNPMDRACVKSLNELTCGYGYGCAGEIGSWEYCKWFRLKEQDRKD
jgi:hypothetical protein